MHKRGVLDIKTFTNITDRRRARTPHGAYLEIASLALHKHRLMKEHQTAEARNAAIEEQIREMDRKVVALRTFVEDPSSFVLEPPRTPVARGPTGEPENRPANPTIREQELRY